eukprot:Pgem_evm8s12025
MTKKQECNVCAYNFTVEKRKPVECWSCAYICCSHCFINYACTKLKNECMNCHKLLEFNNVTKCISKRDLEKINEARGELFFRIEEGKFQETLQFIKRLESKEDHLSRVQEHRELLNNTVSQIMKIRRGISMVQGEVQTEKNYDVNTEMFFNAFVPLEKCTNTNCTGRIFLKEDPEYFVAIPKMENEKIYGEKFLELISHFAFDNNHLQLHQASFDKLTTLFDFLPIPGRDEFENLNPVNERASLPRNFGDIFERSILYPTAPKYFPEEECERNQDRVVFCYHCSITYNANTLQIYNDKYETAASEYSDINVILDQVHNMLSRWQMKARSNQIAKFNKSFRYLDNISKVNNNVRFVSGYEVIIDLIISDLNQRRRDVEDDFGDYLNNENITFGSRYLYNSIFYLFYDDAPKQLQHFRRQLYSVETLLKSIREKIRETVVETNKTTTRSEVEMVETNETTTRSEVEMVETNETETETETDVSVEVEVNDGSEKTKEPGEISDDDDYMTTTGVGFVDFKFLMDNIEWHKNDGQSFICEDKLPENWFDQMTKFKTYKPGSLTNVVVYSTVNDELIINNRMLYRKFERYLNLFKRTQPNKIHSQLHTFLKSVLQNDKLDQSLVHLNFNSNDHNLCDLHALYDFQKQLVFYVNRNLDDLRQFYVVFFPN